MWEELELDTWGERIVLLIRQKTIILPKNIPLPVSLRMPFYVILKYCWRIKKLNMKTGSFIWVTPSVFLYIWPANDGYSLHQWVIITQIGNIFLNVPKGCTLERCFKITANMMVNQLWLLSCLKWVRVFESFTFEHVLYVHICMPIRILAKILEYLSKPSLTLTLWSLVPSAVQI